MNRALVLRLSIPRRGVSQVAAPLSNSTEVPIEIPKRIPRGPTDILRALASTVKTDYTAPDYKYHDDPLLIPVTTGGRKTFALSKESGRKAARFVLRKFPQCFTYDQAEPKIAAFNPPAKTYSEDQEYTEEDLVYFIENNEVVHARAVFESLQEKGVELSQDTLRSLLQLLSFYNCQEADTDETIEAQWYRQDPRNRVNLWRKNAVVEKLFELIQDKDAVAYGAVIQGMAKYRNADAAMTLYEEMRSKGLIPTVNTYNYLIDCVDLARDGEEARTEILEQLLTDMAANGVRPNLHTFNTVLDLCPRLGHMKNAKTVALKTLAEMRKLGIEPSLATYTGVLTTFCRKTAHISDVLKEILPLINEKTLVLRDKRDLNFFRVAMTTCSEHLVDKNLAYKLNELADKHPNFHGNAYRQQNYYNHFMRLLCGTETIEVYMDVFRKYVPNTYIPDISIIIDTLQAIEMYDAIHYLPQLWSDVIMLNYPDKENVLSHVLALTAKFKSSGSPEHDELQQCFMTIAKQMRKHLELVEEDAREGIRRGVYLSATDLSNMIQTFVNGDAVEDAWISVKQLVERQSQLVGVPEVEPLRQFTQRACEAGKITEALFCAKFCSEIGHTDVADWMRDNSEKYTLSTDIRQQLERLVSLPSTPSQP